MRMYGKGKDLVSVLENDWSIDVKGKAREILMDESNMFYDYDLLSLLKGAFVGKIYVDAVDECPDVTEFVALANQVGAISAYAYLGDVANSKKTGDKVDMKFEDDYLDELFDYLSEIGFKSVTYMPSRNTTEQLQRVRDLCDKLDFFQISGEDINSPRQAFTCEALLKPEYGNLITATWAMIGHELEATKDQDNGMFSDTVAKKMPELNKRIEHYATLVK